MKLFNNLSSRSLKNNEGLVWVKFPDGHGLTNQCTRIAKRRLIETGWTCGGALALRVVLPARNRVISSVEPVEKVYRTPFTI
jgi:hypothetical protein